LVLGACVGTNGMDPVLPDRQSYVSPVLHLGPTCCEDENVVQVTEGCIGWPCSAPTSLSWSYGTDDGQLAFRTRSCPPQGATAGTEVPRAVARAAGTRTGIAGHHGTTGLRAH